MTVPEACTVALVAGPEQDLAPEAVAALREFVKKGGRLLVLFDPDYKKVGLSQPRGLVKEWNIEVGEDVVLDLSPALEPYGPRSRSGERIIVPPGQQAPYHEITRSLGLATYYDGARRVAAAQGDPSRRSRRRTSLETSPEFVGGDGPRLKETRASTTERNAKGPVGIAAVATIKASEPPPAPAPEPFARGRHPQASGVSGGDLRGRRLRLQRLHTQGPGQRDAASSAPSPGSRGTRTSSPSLRRIRTTTASPSCPGTAGYYALIAVSCWACRCSSSSSASSAGGVVVRRGSMKKSPFPAHRHRPPRSRGSRLVGRLLRVEATHQGRTREGEAKVSLPRPHQGEVPGDREGRAATPSGSFVTAATGAWRRRSPRPRTVRPSTRFSPPSNRSSPKPKSRPPARALATTVSTLRGLSSR